MKKNYAFAVTELMISLALIAFASIFIIVVVFHEVDERKIKVDKVAFNNEIAVALADMNANEELAGYDSQDKFDEKFKEYFDAEKIADKDVAEYFADEYIDDKGNKFDPYHFTTIEESGAEKQIEFKTRAISSKGVSFAYTYDTSCNPRTNLVQDASQYVKVNGIYNHVAKNAAFSCITGFYDINGANGPNELGKDVLFFQKFTKDCQNPKFLPDPVTGKCPGEASESDVSALSMREKMTQVFLGSSKDAGDGTDDSCGKIPALDVILDPEPHYCSMVEANCQADGSLRTLDQNTCDCVCRLSCPKGYIIDEDKCQCVCDIDALFKTIGCKVDKKGNYVNTKGSNADCAESAKQCLPVYNNEAACNSSACTKNGGTWDGDTFKCKCPSSKTQNNGFWKVRYDSNNCCTLINECKTGAEFDKQATQNLGNRKPEDGYTKALEAPIEEGCWKCPDGYSEIEGYCVIGNECPPCGSEFFTSKKVDGKCTCACNGTKLNEYVNYLNNVNNSRKKLKTDSSYKNIYDSDKTDFGYNKLVDKLIETKELQPIIHDQLIKDGCQNAVQCQNNLGIAQISYFIAIRAPYDSTHTGSANPCDQCLNMANSIKNNNSKNVKFYAFLYYINGVIGGTRSVPDDLTGKISFQVDKEYSNKTREIKDIKIDAMPNGNDEQQEKIAEVKAIVKKITDSAPNNSEDFKIKYRAVTDSGACKVMLTEVVDSPTIQNFGWHGAYGLGLREKFKISDIKIKDIIDKWNDSTYTYSLLGNLADIYRYNPNKIIIDSISDSAYSEVLGTKVCNDTCWQNQRVGKIIAYTSSYDPIAINITSDPAILPAKSGLDYFNFKLASYKDSNGNVHYKNVYAGWQNVNRYAFIVDKEFKNDVNKRHIGYMIGDQYLPDGNKYPTGFVMLKGKYDKNSDGLITRDEMKDLYVWRSYPTNVSQVFTDLTTYAFDINTHSRIVTDATGRAIQNDNMAYSIMGSYRAIRNYGVTSDDKNKAMIYLYGVTENSRRKEYWVKYADLKNYATNNVEMPIYIWYPTGFSNSSDYKFKAWYKKDGEKEISAIQDVDTTRLFYPQKDFAQMPTLDELKSLYNTLEKAKTWKKIMIFPVTDIVFKVTT